VRDGTHEARLEIGGDLPGRDGEGSSGLTDLGKKSTMAHLLHGALPLLSALLLLTGSQALAQQMVSVSGMEVNMRSGPGTQHPADWRLDRGYPLKVIGSQGSWLKVIDFENDKGWIHQSLTSHRPYHVVKVKIANMRSEPTTSGRVIARLAYGEALKTLKRSGGWIKLQGKNGLSGWVAQRLLWGW
jgi:SH3-like domain-containing protein